MSFTRVYSLFSLSGLAIDEWNSQIIKMVEPTFSRV